MQRPTVGGDHLIHWIQPQRLEFLQALGDRCANLILYPRATETGPGGGEFGFLKAFAAGDEDGTGGSSHVHLVH